MTAITFPVPSIASVENEHSTTRLIQAIRPIVWAVRIASGQFLNGPTRHEPMEIPSPRSCRFARQQCRTDALREPRRRERLHPIANRVQLYKSFFATVRINGLGGNCSQAIDLYDSYTYTSVPVGVRWHYFRQMFACGTQELVLCRVWDAQEFGFSTSFFDRSLGADG